MKTIAIIPARLQSNRFPNKLLKNFLGKPIIQHVIENTKQFDFIDKLIVATENKKIVDLCNKLNVETFFMEASVSCGSKRAYHYFLQNKNYDYYLSVPSDEPIINPVEVNKAWKNCDTQGYYIYTFYTDFHCVDDLKSRLSCKIVSDKAGCILYSSRNIVPATKDGSLLSLEKYKKNVGIFVFEKKMLEHHGNELWSKDSFLANVEGLEQNMWLENNFQTKLIKIRHIGFGIDVPEQIGILENRLRNF